MDEFKCEASIKPSSGVPHARLGMPIKITVGNGIRKVQRPADTQVSFTFHAKEGRGLRGDGLVGLFSMPKGTGHDWWLLLSWLWLTSNTDDAVHVHRLGEPDGKWNVHFIYPTVKCSAVWDRKGMRLLTTHLTKPVMASVCPDPTGEGTWLAGRLQTRLAPACLRVVDPTHIQLWMKL